MAENEDIDYTVSDFATPDDNKSEQDEDQPNKSVLLEVQKYLKEAIEEHNTLDVIDLKRPGKMTPTQQVAVHKLVVHHLRDIKSTVDTKIRELS